MIRTTRIAMAAALTLLLPHGASLAADWTLETIQDPATYQALAVLHQESAGTIGDEYGKKAVRPRLEFRCAPGSGEQVAVRIDWRRFISSFNTEVTFAADDAEPLTLSLGVDRSNRITATRKDGDDAALIEYLSGADALTVTVTPYSDVPVSVDYDLAALTGRLAELRDACTA
ncbi:MAG: hypothetical protein U5K76_01705 [Woeseiaceae bacterium]|nr:hypothetical protein [Woeseiaceae bacterium]